MIPAGTLSAQLLVGLDQRKSSSETTCAALFSLKGDKDCFGARDPSCDPNWPPSSLKKQESCSSNDNSFSLLILPLDSQPISNEGSVEDDATFLPPILSFCIKFCGWGITSFVLVLWVLGVVGGCMVSNSVSASSYYNSYVCNGKCSVPRIAKRL